MAKIRLDGAQVRFIKEMFEVTDGEQAMKLLASMMVEEKLDPEHMPSLIDRCIKKMKERK